MVIHALHGHFDAFLSASRTMASSVASSPNSASAAATAAEILPRGLLPDKLVERFRAQGGVNVFGAARRSGEAVVGHAWLQNFLALNSKSNRSIECAASILGVVHDADD